MKSLYLIVLVLCLTTLNHVVADQAFRPHAVGASFGRSYREPKYKIEFHPEDSPFHPDDDQESLILPNKDGQKFLCYIPKEEKAKSGKPVSPYNTSSLILGTEKEVKLKTPDELLEVLKDQCLARQEGWWSYEFCYQKEVKQVHVEDGKAVQEFVLGVYDAEATAASKEKHSDSSILKDPTSGDASQKYHAHQYTNGTICDLTNQPRETEVRFVCSEPRIMISAITELSTCKYALTVECPMLCKHPLFQDERPVWHTINCNALPKDYKEQRTEKDNNFKDKEISMPVPDIEYQSNYGSGEYAT